MERDVITLLFTRSVTTVDVFSCFRRKSRFRGTPRNILRHIYVSELQDVSFSLPPVVSI